MQTFPIIFLNRNSPYQTAYAQYFSNDKPIQTKNLEKNKKLSIETYAFSGCTGLTV